MRQRGAVTAVPGDPDRPAVQLDRSGAPPDGLDEVAEHADRLGRSGTLRLRGVEARPALGGEFERERDAAQPPGGHRAVNHRRGALDVVLVGRQPGDDPVECDIGLRQPSRLHQVDDLLFGPGRLVRLHLVLEGSSAGTAAGARVVTVRLPPRHGVTSRSPP
jgi:hypothetical protein